MKKYNEIIKLLDAGFTRDEILAMEEEQVQDPEPETPEQTEEPSAPQQAENAIMQAVNSMLEKMDRKLTELQAANIYSSQQPGGADQHEKTAEEALEEIIRPYRPQ